ncbi:MAG: right-handed parallel beta-helix repeat-containing protein [Acidobacteria bacterium]|nr:right-handed parallel beta-helix repeat-containing protein [Acidobacteriota bacterium]
MFLGALGLWALGAAELSAAFHYVRPDNGTLGDGSSYLQAWRGLANVGWSEIEAGDTLWICGLFQGTSERILLPAGPDGTEGKPGAAILLDGDCFDSRGYRHPGRIVAPEVQPPAEPPAYGIETRRRDHYHFRNLELEGYSVLVLDSVGIVFENVEIRDAPLRANVYGAVDDRSLGTTYDGLRIVNAGGNGLSQGGRGRNAFWTPPPGSLLWATANTFLTKRDFQENPVRTVVRDSVIDTVGRREDYTGYHALDLYWNHEVLVENTTVTDPGASGIRVHTSDRSPIYDVRTAGVTGCPPSCASHPGFQCLQPLGGGTEVCIDPEVDSLPTDAPVFGEVDAFVQGAPTLVPSVILRGNTIRTHFQTGPRPQCIYGATGQTCDAANPCPFGYTCSGGACSLVGGDCGNQHYGVVVPPGAPFVGTLLAEGNVIQGFAGNGILVETPYELVRASPPGPSITVRGNDISGSGHWGIWISHHQQVYPTGGVLIEGNRIHDNGTPYFDWAHGGIQINAATANVTVENNFIYRNGERSLDFDYASKHGGLVLASAPNGFAPRDIRIVDNTFVDNHTANVMTFHLTPSTVTDPIEGLEVAGNLSFYSSSYAYQTRHTGVHAAWRLAPAGTAPPRAPEWSVLGPNLYFAAGLPTVVVDPRTFSIGTLGLSTFAAYQWLVHPFEAGSLTVDPDLDADLLPQNPAASGFGAR